MRWLALVMITTGCATATEQDVLITRSDSGTPDTTPVDTGTAPDTAKPSCESLPGATCKPGATRMSPCGNCGTVTDTCDLDTCTWIAGKCTGEGVCDPDGPPDETMCTAPGEVKRRTCEKTCTWGPYGACAVLNPWKQVPTPPTGFEGRYHHSAVWTGTEMIVFGGLGATGAKKDGAAYDPIKDSWRLIAPPPAHFSKGRKQHSAVWTGSRMIVWGGLDTDNFYATTNAAYDPKTDTWTDVKTVAIAGRSLHYSAWTGSEMLVFGGGNSDGALFDPATDTWTIIPAPPSPMRAGTNHVWTGNLLVTWGACFGVACTSEGATYDPKTKTWTKLPDPPSGMDGRFEAVAATEGGAALFWSGYGGTDVSNLIKKTGGKWDPSTGWKSMSSAEGVITPSGGRQSAQSWVAKGKLFVFGGRSDASPSAESGGGVYDLATDKWTALPATDAPSARVYATVVWTGSEAIVWGGTQTPGVPSAILRDGARYRP